LEHIGFYRRYVGRGEPDAFIQSIDAFAGGRAPLRDNPESFRESLKLADPDAQAAANGPTIATGSNFFRGTFISWNFS